MRQLRIFLSISIVLLAPLGLVAQNINKGELDQLLSKYVKNNEPGFAVGIVVNGELKYSKGFGLANLDYDIKNTDSTIFSLASIAKQFTAAAIWSLIRQKKVGLDDDIREYLPELPVYGSTIKIKHLLNHSSGIRNYHTLMQLSGFDYDQDFYNNDSVFNLIRKQKKLNDLPGKRMFYSNSNYTLLAILAERLSGQNLNTYLQEQILKPLGMSSTFVRVEHGLPIKNRAIGYQNTEVGFRFNVTNQLSYGAGSMGSSIKDMSIWIQMLNDNLSKFRDLSTFLKTPDTLNTGLLSTYARGLQLDTYGNLKTYSHSGFGFGNQSQLLVIPEKQLGIVILTNQQSIDPTPLSYRLLDRLYPQTSAANKWDFKASNSKIDVPYLKTFTGDYLEINSDLKMTFSIKNDTLQVVGSNGKNKIPLIPFHQNAFHRLNSENVKYYFKESDNYDLKIEFGGTPFYFEKVILKSNQPKDLEDYTGHYFSEELNVTYQIQESDSNLTLTYPNNNSNLRFVSEDCFGNSNRTIYKFDRDSEGVIGGFILGSEGQVGDITFIKQPKF